jgi:hypothetical protein
MATMSSPKDDISFSFYSPSFRLLFFLAAAAGGPLSDLRYTLGEMQTGIFAGAGIRKQKIVSVI